MSGFSTSTKACFGWNVCTVALPFYCGNDELVHTKMVCGHDLLNPCLLGPNTVSSIDSDLPITLDCILLVYSCNLATNPTATSSMTPRVSNLANTSIMRAENFETLLWLHDLWIRQKFCGKFHLLTGTYGDLQRFYGQIFCPSIINQDSENQLLYFWLSWTPTANA